MNVVAVLSRLGDDPLVLAEAILDLERRNETLEGKIVTLAQDHDVILEELEKVKRGERS